MALFNAMELDIMCAAMNCTSSKKLWEYLQLSYSTKSSLSHAYSVTHAYTRCEQGDSNLTEYFTCFKKLYNELQTLFPISNDPVIQQERQDKLAVFTVIGGLSPKYASSRLVLLSHSAISSLPATYHLLQEMYPTNTMASGSNSDTSALVVTRPHSLTSGNGKRGGSLASASDSDKRIQCHFCKGFGHMKQNCPTVPGRDLYLGCLHVGRSQPLVLRRLSLHLPVLPPIL